MIVWADEVPSVGAYLALRAAAGLGSRSTNGAAIGLANGLHAITAREGGALVAMGEMVGDGGCFAMVTDVAVAPGRQGDGLGAGVMRRLVAWCEAELLAPCHLSLICLQSRAPFYERFAFRRTQGVDRFADPPAYPLDAE